MKVQTTLKEQSRLALQRHIVGKKIVYRKDGGERISSEIMKVRIFTDFLHDDWKDTTSKLPVTVVELELKSLHVIKVGMDDLIEFDE